MLMIDDGCVSRHGRSIPKVWALYRRRETCIAWSIIAIYGWKHRLWLWHYTLHWKNIAIRKFTWRETEENRAADDGALDDPPWPQVLCCLLGAAEQGGVAVVNLERPTFEFILGKAICLSISSNRDLCRVMQAMRTHVPFKFWLLYTSQTMCNTTMFFYSHVQSKTRYRNHQKVTSWVQTLTRNWIPTRSGMVSLHLQKEIKYVLYQILIIKHSDVRDRNWWKGTSSDCLERNSIQNTFNKTLLTSLLKFFFFFGYVYVWVFLFLRDSSQKVDSPNDRHTQREEGAFLLN